MIIINVLLASNTSSMLSRMFEMLCSVTHLYFSIISCFRYVASVEGKVNMRHLQAISKGTLVEGVHCAPVSVELIPLGNEKRQRVRIVVSIPSISELELLFLYIIYRVDVING